MRYILVLHVITVLGCAPAANSDAKSVSKNEPTCESMAASYEAAKNRKTEIEAKTADKQSVGIEETVFSWPSLVVKRLDEFSDTNAASNKMRNLKNAMKKQNCEGFENIPSTLQRLYTGQNFGKQLLKLADPE